MMNYIGWEIPEGKVIKVEDADGNLIWQLPSGGKMVFQAKTVTNTTYAGETSYSNEVFLLLDVYPKTNGTVSVTYGGLTKIVTDTSGAKEPNAQQVFFGTFNGVSDGEETPTSGTLTVDGDYRGVGQGSFATDSKNTTKVCECIKNFDNWGNVEVIPDNAFYVTLEMTDRKDCNFPEGLKSIGANAFYNVWTRRVHIPSTVISISGNPWSVPHRIKSLTVANENTAFNLDENCLIEIATGRLVCAPYATHIPSYVTSIDANAFSQSAVLVNITIPMNVASIGKSAFYACGTLTDVTILATTPPVYEGDSSTHPLFKGCDALATITVPAGCGETYKTADGWSAYADKIVEAS